MSHESIHVRPARSEDAAWITALAPRLHEFGPPPWREIEVMNASVAAWRLLPAIRSGNRAERLAAERIAMNMPIQGSAADVLKLAMLALRKPVTPGARMILSVHDELVFEVPEAEVDEAKRRIKSAMESALELAVPLTVDVGSGKNWNTAH